MSFSRGSQTRRVVLDRTPPSATVAPALDVDQQRVVDHRTGPLLVLAGPGTGKTTTITEAIAARFAEGVSGEAILALTFGRAAAAELRDRVIARTRGGVAPSVVTFHSFCYSLIQRFAEPDSPAPRLLSGSEQRTRVLEIMRNSKLDWPPSLRQAVTVGSFADELVAVMARVRSVGMDPEDLARLAQAEGDQRWQAAAKFFEEYLDVTDLEGVMDYSELIHRAVLLAQRDDVRAFLRSTYRYIYVDEYQDTDPRQVALLRAMVGPETTVVVVGDPDQSIYGFRGADVGGILSFTEAFRCSDGSPAPDVVLRHTRRFGPLISKVARRALGSRGYPGISKEMLDKHREPTTDASKPESVEIITASSTGVQAAAIAELLRRARLDADGDPLPWSSMAVLVRSSVISIPDLARALGNAGVPIEVSSADVTIAADPAVRALLTAAEAVIALSKGDALGHQLVRELLLGPLGNADPGDLRHLGRALRQASRSSSDGVLSSDEAIAAALQRRVRALSGRQAQQHPSAQLPGLTLSPSDAAAPDSEPESQADPESTRGGQRPGVKASSVSAERRDADRPESPDRQPESQGDPESTRGGQRPGVKASSVSAERRDADRPESPDRQPESQGAAERRDADRPEPPDQGSEPVARAHAAIERVAALLAHACHVAEAAAAPDEILWALWAGKDDAQLATGWPAALKSAGRDRELDAMCELFDFASGAVSKANGVKGLSVLIEQIQSADVRDSTSAPGGERDAVQVMTAHRAKGREWDLVVVADVNEGVWPDLRIGGSFLAAEQIDAEGIAEPASRADRLAEERRLFFVACTRARRRLVIAAVSDADISGGEATSGGSQPSRFLSELLEINETENRMSIQHVSRRPKRSLSMTAFVAELRYAAVDPELSPALRQAAVERLAHLASMRDDRSFPLVPQAHPDQWWGELDWTEAERTVRPTDAPVKLSASAIEKIDSCPLQWFLLKEASADTASSSAQGFGSLIHALAADLADGEIEPDLAVLEAKLDEYWAELSFTAQYVGEKQRREAREVLQRLINFHEAEAANAQRVEAEHEFEVTFTATSGEGEENDVTIRGSMDRVQVDKDNRVQVIDYKTSKAALKAAEVKVHVQLGVYQVVVREGALPGYSGDDAVAGAQLVQLRDGKGDQAKVQRQEPIAVDGDGHRWIDLTIGDAAAAVRAEAFVATPQSDMCKKCPVASACPTTSRGAEVIS